MQLVEVVIQGAAALGPQCRAQYALGHKGIAVAIPADPAAQPQKGRQTLRERYARAGKLLFQIGVKPRQPGEKGMIVVGKAVGHLVDDTQAGAAQRIGLPQGQHGAAQRRLVRSEFSRGRSRPVAFRDQLGDFHLAVDRAFAPHFGRMRGQYRHDHGAGKEGAEARRRDARLTGAGEGMRQRAFARCRGAQGMGAGPADMVLILGDIGEVGKEAEGANNLQRLLRHQTVQRCFEIAPRRQILVSAEADRVLPNVLDSLEDCFPALLAYRVAKNAAEQPDIFAKRQVLVFGLDCRAGLHAPPLSIAVVDGSLQEMCLTSDGAPSTEINPDNECYLTTGITLDRHWGSWF